MSINKDTKRTVAAARAIIDNRVHAASVMVTLEHTVAAVLLTLYPDPHVAAGMLNEALVQGVEQRLAGYGAKKC
jgi:capsid protein